MGVGWRIFAMTTDFWEDVSTYIRSRTDAEFTHSICPDCKAEHFPTL